MIQAVYQGAKCWSASPALDVFADVCRRVRGGVQSACADRSLEGGVSQAQAVAKCMHNTVGALRLNMIASLGINLGV